MKELNYPTVEEQRKYLEIARLYNIKDYHPDGQLEYSRGVCDKTPKEKKRETKMDSSK